jgi:hypothetical protein
MTENHCRDCCCARAWKALGFSEYTGKSIVEHIELLKGEVAALKLEVAVVERQRNEIIELRNKAHECQCVCHDFPQHNKLQDALEANRWHIDKVVQLEAECNDLNALLQDTQADYGELEARMEATERGLSVLSGIPPVDESNSDPIFQNMVTHLWHFWDETWSDLHGPYQTEKEAREACTEYAKTI